MGRYNSRHKITGGLPLAPIYQYIIKCMETPIAATR